MGDVIFLRPIHYCQRRYKYYSQIAIISYKNYISLAPPTLLDIKADIYCVIGCFNFARFIPMLAKGRMGGLNIQAQNDHRMGCNGKKTGLFIILYIVYVHHTSYFSMWFWRKKRLKAWLRNAFFLENIICRTRLIIWMFLIMLVRKHLKNRWFDK